MSLIRRRRIGCFQPLHLRGFRRAESGGILTGSLSFRFQPLHLRGFRREISPASSVNSYPYLVFSPSIFGDSAESGRGKARSDGFVFSAPPSSGIPPSVPWQSIGRRKRIDVFSPSIFGDSAEAKFHADFINPLRSPSLGPTRGKHKSCNGWRRVDAVFRKTRLRRGPDIACAPAIRVSWPLTRANYCRDTAGGLSLQEHLRTSAHHHVPAGPFSVAAPHQRPRLQRAPTVAKVAFANHRAGYRRRDVCETVSSVDPPGPRAIGEQKKPQTLDH